jgi:hypothetical protein
MAHMHNPALSVTLAFCICRLHWGEPTGMRSMKRRNTDRRGAFTSHIRKDISRTRIRIESST